MNMKRIQILLTMLFIVTFPVIGQVKIDTLFYDKNWKGVDNEAFATYYRIIYHSNDSNYCKKFRDFYISGELQSEGEYISIDKYDDSKSVFDGEWINYYKSGKIEQKGNRIGGKQEGEYTKYNEDGLVSVHAYFTNDKLDGIYTEFSEDCNLCMQVEYRNGELLNDYYVVSNRDGFCSKIRMSDRQPIYESPSLDEKQVEYKNGETWPYYNKNGIMIGLTNNLVRDYGKYFQIPIIISNNSMFPIEFEPNKVTASLIDKKGEKRELKVYTAEEYMKKVRRRQNWAMVLNGLAEGMSAASAGYSSSTTNSSYSGCSSSFGNASAYGTGGYTYGNYSGNSSYYGVSSSTTTSYNGAAAYQAQVIANDRIAAYDNMLLSERSAKDEGYLKRTTIHPGETISGYINIERKKCVSMTVNIDINGAVYTYPWDISK